jgi:hypothetical protein
MLASVEEAERLVRKWRVDSCHLICALEFPGGRIKSGGRVLSVSSTGFVIAHEIRTDNAFGAFSLEVVWNQVQDARYEDLRGFGPQTQAQMKGKVDGTLWLFLPGNITCVLIEATL